MRSTTILKRAAVLVGLGGSAFACSGLLGLTDPGLDEDFDAGTDFGDTGTGPVTDTGTTDGGSGDCAGDDLTGDPENCGVCGHSCLGGGCTASACQPVLVASDPNVLAPYHMVFNGGMLYVSDVRPPDLISNVIAVSADALENDPPYSFVAKITQPDGGNPHGAYPYELAIAGSSIFITITANEYVNPGGAYFGGIAKCPITGCTDDPVDPATIAITGVNSGAVANGGSIIMHDAYKYNDAGDAVDFRESSGLTSTGAALVLDKRVINWISVDSDNAYVATENGIWSFDISNTPTKKQLSAVRGEMLAVDTANVYYSSAFTSNPAVFSVPKGGGSSSDLTNGLTMTTPAGVGVDATSMYFADEGTLGDDSTGHVYRCSLTNCQGTIKQISTGASDNNNPRAVLVTANAVYWGARAGKIWKLAK